MYQKNPNIILVSDYDASQKPATFQCLICGNQWTSKEARTVLRGHGCPECSKRNRVQKSADSRRHTNQWFLTQLNKIHPNLVPQEPYQDMNTKIRCKCTTHGIIIHKNPVHLLTRKQGCPICAVEQGGQTKYTPEVFAYFLNKYNPHIKLLSPFRTVKDRVRVKCEICGYEWNPLAGTLIAKTHTGCPQCAGNAVKTSEDFREEMSYTHTSLSLLSDYVRSNRPVKVKCKDCGEIFEITPNKLQQGHGCPNCRRSSGEQSIRSYLQYHKIEYIPQYKFDDLLGIGGRKLSYDFYVPSCRLLIEYHGEQHEHPVQFYSSQNDIDAAFAKQQEHDRRKMKYAKLRGYALLVIWYYDFKNIYTILQKTFQHYLAQSKQNTIS